MALIKWPNSAGWWWHLHPTLALRAVFIHSEGDLLSSTCVDGLNASRRRWVTAPQRGEIVYASENMLV